MFHIRKLESVNGIAWVRGVSVAVFTQAHACESAGSGAPWLPGLSVSGGNIENAWNQAGCQRAPGSGCSVQRTTQWLRKEASFWRFLSTSPAF